MTGDKERSLGGKAKKVAVYTRLSVNEYGRRDDSLDTQRALLAGYVQEQGLGDPLFYVDSDISGTYFDRPGLVRMVGDINSGLIGTVVVKDLSRLGRNNGETLTFLDFLHEKKVRLISLGDGYDSFRDEDDTIGIRTWVNEYYARDISRKVRANLKKKMQSGEFLGRPPFGYRKSTRLKNRLEVDERYREIIRQIFTLYIQGWGYRALADYVQRLKVPTPSQDKGYARAPSARRWEGQHIRRIITNRVYCGDTVQGVSEKLSFKTRKTRRLPGEQWIIVPGTHEPIVTREIYELAQQVRKRRLEGAGRRSCRNAGPHLFTGLLFCAACGARHVYRKKGARQGGYVCGRYNRYGRRGCTSHHVTENLLIRLILRDVREMTAGVPFHDELAGRYKDDLAAAGGKNRIDILAGEIETRRRQLKTVYMDKVRGLIAEDLFLEICTALHREIRFLERQFAMLRARNGGFRTDEDLEVVRSMGPEMLDEGDIDRHFLELFVKRIIIWDEGDTAGGQPAPAKDPIVPWKRVGKARGAANMKGLVIIYNLVPPTR